MPNHHFSVHLYDQILDYGPVYGFWCFLQERLNYILKAFKTNNRGKGILEVTLMRSFAALSWLREVVSTQNSTSFFAFSITVSCRFKLQRPLMARLAQWRAR